MSILDFASGITGANPVQSAKLVVGGLIIGAVLLGGGLLAWKYHSLTSEIESLTKDNGILTSNNKILQENNNVIKANMATLVDANKVNAATAQALVEERKQSQTAISTLANTTASDKAVIAKLNQKLKDLIKDPTNDGPLAPALRETVRQVQNTRSPK
jgi:cell division protein FtsB